MTARSPRKAVETRDEWIARHLAMAPKPTTEQIDLIRRIFINHGLPLPTLAVPPCDTTVSGAPERSTRSA